MNDKHTYMIIIIDAYKVRDRYVNGSIDFFVIYDNGLTARSSEYFFWVIIRIQLFNMIYNLRYSVTINLM